VIECIRQTATFDDGFWKIYTKIRKAGHIWNHKKVYRVYKQIHFNKRVRLKKRLPVRIKQPLSAPGEPNVTWSMDFVTDTLTSNRSFRVLNIIDDYNREAIGQETSLSMPSKRVTRILEKVIWIHGKPQNIRVDNGTEFTSGDFREWCEGNGINILYTQPGKPTQNSYIERFNGSNRRAVLDAYLFRTLKDVREITSQWMDEYNNNRPHEALGDMSPIEYKQEEMELSEKI